MPFKKQSAIGVYKIPFFTINMWDPVDSATLPL